MKSSRVSLLLWASAGCSLLSLLVPAILCERVVFNGWIPLLFGWTAVLYGIYGWLANLALVFVGFGFLIRKRRFAAAAAGVGFVVALDSLRLVGRAIPMDEAGVNMAKVVALGPGFYLWLAAILLLAAFAWMSEGARGGGGPGPIQVR